MNILIIAECFPPVLNSSAKLLSELVSELNKDPRVKKIHVLTEHKSRQSSNNDKLSIDEVKIYLPKKKNFFIRALREIYTPLIFGLIGRKIISRHNIDKVFIYSPPMPLGLCKLFFRKTYSILNIQDIFPQFARDLKVLNSKIIYRIYLYMQKLSISINNKVICQSNECADYLKKIYPTKQSKISFALNWQSYNESFLSDYKKSKKIIYVGNFGPAQGIHNYIKGIESLSLEFDIDFWGHGSDLSKFLHHFDNISLRNNLSYKGILKHESLFEEIKKASFGLVFLSKDLATPTLPGKMLTYIEFGIPVIAIAPKKTFLAEFVKTNNLGISFDECNFNSINDIDIKKIKNYSNNFNPEALSIFLEKKLSPKHAVQKIFFSQ